MTPLPQKSSSIVQNRPLHAWPFIRLYVGQNSSIAEWASFIESVARVHGIGTGVTHIGNVHSGQPCKMLQRRGSALTRYFSAQLALVLLARKTKRQHPLLALFYVAACTCGAQLKTN